MLALHHPPPPYHPGPNHHPYPSPPPRYTITVNISTMGSSQSTNRDSSHRPLVEKHHIDDRKSWSTASQGGLSPDEYHAYHAPPRQTPPASLYPSISPAPSRRRSMLCNLFAKKPSMPCPEFKDERFLLYVGCTTCAAKVDQTCEQLPVWNTSGGRLAYRLFLESAPEATPAQVDEQRRKIKDKLKRTYKTDLEERVLWLDLCRWYGRVDLARILGLSMKTLGDWDYSNGKLADELRKEVVDVGGLMERLERNNIAFDLKPKKTDFKSGAWL
ncbi:hypothetical protein QBC39DRAFT_349905 [Podospora conica]|nr:hypothetical protein QBC39DRAFT_349905 [Schizothecium conicum]